MDFDLSPDQAALRDAAREFLDAQCGPARVRTIHDGGQGWDSDLWQAMASQGWLGVAVPEDDGGLGLGAVELAVLLEQAGRHVAPVPLLPTLMAIELVRRSEDRALLEPLVDGSRTACVVWSAGTSSVRASQHGAGWRLDGRSDPTVFAPVANLAVVIAESADGPGVFIADLDVLGRPGIEPAMDLTRPIGWLEFAAAPAVRLGDSELAEYALDFGATAVALELLGASEIALEMAVQYAKDRVQFGRPIGSFQAVKHRCADMLVDVEGMRSSAYWAAWCLGVGDDDRAIAASTAKSWSGDASKRVMAGALQVHGGIGFTWEHDLHLWMKRAQLDQLTFGDSVWHRSRLGRLLRAKIDAGESVL